MACLHKKKEYVNHLFKKGQNFCYQASIQLHSEGKVTKKSIAVYKNSNKCLTSNLHFVAYHKNKENPKVTKEEH